MRNTRAIFGCCLADRAAGCRVLSRNSQHPLTPFSILFGRLMARL